MITELLIWEFLLADVTQRSSFGYTVQLEKHHFAESVVVSVMELTHLLNPYLQDCLPQ